MSACDQETSNTEGSNNEETKHDHQAINNQVRQYFQTIQYNDEVSQNVVNVNAFGDVDLSSLHNEDFQIDASIATDNDKDDDSISAAAAAVAAYQHQLHTQQQEKLKLKQKQRQKELLHQTPSAEYDPQLSDPSNKSVTQKIDHHIPAKSDTELPHAKNSESATTNVPSSDDGKLSTSSQVDKPLLGSTSNSSSTTGSAGTPFRLLEVLPGVDPKKMCLFCGKTFAHPGSLGRHLDNRKGSPLHPADKIDQLRANVARRGDPVAVKARRSLRARDYNRREHVKEKNRERRKYQSKIYRVKEAAELNFYKQLSMPSLPAHPSFPRMVLFFLPPSAWPHDPPTFQTYDTLCEWLKTNKNIQEKLPLLAIRTPSGTGGVSKKGKEAIDLSNIDANQTSRSYLEKLKIAFDNWLSLPNDGKKDMWIREQRICAQEALGQLTLFDYAVRETWTRKLTEDKRREVIAAAVATNGLKMDVSGSMTSGTAEESDGNDEDVKEESDELLEGHESSSPHKRPKTHSQILDDAINSSFYQHHSQGTDDRGMSDGGINEADGADEEGAKNELEEAAYAAVAAAAAAVGVDQQHEERV